MRQSEPQVKRAVVLRALLIVLLSVIAYFPAIQGGFIWDDDAYLTENPEMESINGWHQIWLEKPSTHQYYPLVLSSFRLEHHLWGLHPLGYHLINVLLHGMNAVLLWLILRKLGMRGAWIAGVLFALHPVMVESVAWITERKNVMSGAFYLLSLLAYLRFEPFQQEENPKRNPAFYFLSLGLFLCALLSKTVTCSLPVILGILIWWKHGGVTRRQIAPLLPFLAMGLGMGLGTAWLEKHSIGAQGSEYTLTLLERGLLAGKALWFYIGKLVLPTDLTFIYPHWNIQASDLVLFIYPLGFFCLLGMLWGFRNRIGRGPLAAFLVFSITLFPALGFINVFPFRYSYVADHFQYLASAGLIALAASGIARLDSINQTLRPALTWALIGLLGLLTWTQSYSYTSLEALWRDTLEKNPSAVIAHFNLANLLGKRGKSSEAIEHYSACVQLQPEFYEAYANRAGLLALQGKREQARLDYLEALRVASKKGDRDAQMIIRRSLEGLPREGEAPVEPVRGVTSEGSQGLSPCRWSRFFNLASGHKLG